MAKLWLGKVRALFHFILSLRIDMKKRVYQNFDTPSRTFAIPHYKPNGKTIYFSKEELVEWIKKHPVKTKDVYEQDAIRYVMNKPLKSR